MPRDGAVNANFFLRFFKQMMIGTDRPIYLLADGYSIHKTKIIKDYVTGLDGMLELYYPPPYSSRLNPNELVWMHVEREASRPLVNSKEEMKRLVPSVLHCIQKLPTLVRSPAN